MHAGASITLCSTPYGVIEWFAVGSQGEGGVLAAGCSTPYGVIEWFARLDREINTRATECSTPYGVIEWFAPSRERLARKWHCAQRLTASLNGSHR